MVAQSTDVCLLFFNFRHSPKEWRLSVVRITVIWTCQRAVAWIWNWKMPTNFSAFSFPQHEHLLCSRYSTYLGSYLPISTYHMDDSIDWSASHTCLRGRRLFFVFSMRKDSDKNSFGMPASSRRRRPSQPSPSITPYVYGTYAAS